MYNLKIILRILIIGAFMFLFTYSIQQDKWYMTSITTFFMSLILMAELIWYLHKSQRRLSNLILAVKQKDFTGSFKGISKQGSSKLDLAFQEIMDEFNNISIEKEVHYQYLLTIVEHVNIALICFDTSGNIEFFNKEAKSLLDVRNLRVLDDLDKVDQNLKESIKHISPGKSQLIRLKKNDELLQLSLSGTKFKLKDKLFYLVSLSNIKSELAEQELISWKKLIKILRHEIMNSITPITSLSSAINKMLRENISREKDIAFLKMEDLEDLQESTETIEKRSKGLLKFVDVYRDLTKIPDPTFHEIDVRSLINHITRLLQSELTGIHIETNLPDEEINIIADQDMIEQVLINLIINAKEALTDIEDSLIIINTGIDKDRVFINIRDNGRGISDEDIDQIFVPFFTTKEQGSGIGLSISKQIMQLHKGSIDVTSKPGEGAAFKLWF